MSMVVKVVFKQAPIGKAPNQQATTSLQVQAKTESAVLAALRQHNPKNDYIVLKIE